MAPGEHLQPSLPYSCNWHTGCQQRFRSKRQLFEHLESEHGLRRRTDRWSGSGLGARQRRRDARWQFDDFGQPVIQKVFDKRQAFNRVPKGPGISEAPGYIRRRDERGRTHWEPAELASQSQSSAAAGEQGKANAIAMPSAAIQGSESVSRIFSSIDEIEDELERSIVSNFINTPGFAERKLARFEDELWEYEQSKERKLSRGDEAPDSLDDKIEGKRREVAVVSRLCKEGVLCFFGKWYRRPTHPATLGLSSAPASSLRPADDWTWGSSNFKIDRAPAKLHRLRI